MPPLVPDDTTFARDDERNFALYIAVLKAKADGLSDLEIAQHLLGIDTAREPGLARETVEALHRRALQLTEPDTLKQIASPDADQGQSDPVHFPH